MSSAKAEWKLLYATAKLLGSSYVRCAQSGLLMHKSEADCHHPWGRVGDRILAFVWISRTFHEHLHQFGKQSAALGWLQPAFRGGAYDPHYKRPWPQWAEEYFPQKYKRLDTQPDNHTEPCTSQN